MPGKLSDSPARVVRQLLINLGVVNEVGAAVTPYWPAYSPGEPPSPDNVVTVYNTSGQKDSRDKNTREMEGHHGIQVRIRGIDQATAFQKANDVTEALDKRVRYTAVTVGANQYIVKAVSRTGEAIDIGKETPSSKRSLFTVNALVAVRQTN
jgi:hypothetical protein